MIEKFTQKTLMELGESYVDSTYVGHSLPQELQDHAVAWESSLAELTALLRKWTEKRQRVVDAMKVFQLLSPGMTWAGLLPSDVEQKLNSALNGLYQAITAMNQLEDEPPAR